MNAKKLRGGRNSSVTLVNEEREGQVQLLKITAIQNRDWLKKKVKQYRYRPGQAQRVPGS